MLKGETHMKFWKKYSIITIVAVLFFSFTVGNSSAAENVSEKEQIKIAQIIQQNIQLNSATHTLSIKNEDTLKKDLQGVEAITYEQVVNVINTFNNSITGQEGQIKQEQVKTELNNMAVEYEKNDQSMSTMGACSNYLGVLGFLHTTSLSALALALGVSGPAALAVVTGLGAIYVGGSIICPD